MPTSDTFLIARSLTKATHVYTLLYPSFIEKLVSLPGRRNGLGGHLDEGVRRGGVARAIQVVVFVFAVVFLCAAVDAAHTQCGHVVIVLIRGKPSQVVKHKKHSKLPVSPSSDYAGPPQSPGAMEEPRL